MRRVLATLFVVAFAGLTACGRERGNAPLTVRQALTGPAEALEFESVATRAELFREIAHASELEAGKNDPETLFPIVEGSRRVAGAGFQPGQDLLAVADAGQTVNLVFNGRGVQRWPEDRRQSLFGLSEREVAEYVARSLLAHWGIQPQGDVVVDRAAGAPYAVAYGDGIIRVNPSFLYLATSMSAANP